MGLSRFYLNMFSFLLNQTGEGQSAAYSTPNRRSSIFKLETSFLAANFKMLAKVLVLEWAEVRQGL